jgi:CHAT domain-containing protein
MPGEPPANAVPGDAAELAARLDRLLTEFEATGDPDRLARASELLAMLTRAVPAGAELPAEVLDSTSRLAFGRFLVHADPEQVDTMVRTARAVRTLVGGAQGAAELARTLLLRFDHAHDPADLEEVRRLVEPYAAQSPVAATVLANSLRIRFELSPDTALLDRAVELVTGALARLPTPDTDRRNALEVRLICLTERYQHLDDDADLDAALVCVRELAAMTGPARRDRAVTLVSEATLLGMRARRSQSLADVDQALAASEAALEVAATLALTRHQVLGRHGELLGIRFLLSGERADLSAAIGFVRRAVAAAADAPLDRGEYRVRLTSLLTVDAELEGHGGRLAEAVRVGRAAVAAGPVGHPRRARAMLALADVYAARYLHTDDPADLHAAAGLRRVASGTLSASDRDRLRATRLWLGTALQLRDMPSAARAAATGVAMLPVVASRGLHRAGQERRLAQATGIPGVAAALAVDQGRPERAVELIEHGRTVLWAQAAQLRDDLSPLAAVDPALAGELDRARRELAGESVDPARRRAAAQTFDGLLARARALPGFGHFLDTPPFRTLRAAARGGSVVIVNVSVGRSDAPVVRPDAVHVVPLPWLSPAAAQQRAAAWLGAVTDDPQWTDLRLTLESLLRWLWDVVAAPVLSTLDTLDGRVRHRVWWCPTGPLALLPLHAAGRYGSSRGWSRRPTVPDRTTSSYTTGLSALLRARRPAGPGDPTLLAVGMPETAGRPPLPAVTAELTRIADALPGTVLSGRSASPAAVLSRLDSHRWLHLACHATQQVDRPGDSAVHLYGGDLSALRLAGRHLPDADLAYLSACRTATGTQALADEAIHLAAALQLAGYRHVIGTLWGVSDQHAAAVAGEVYDLLTGHRPADAGRAAHALARATASLRERHPDRPELWAPFVHFGP